MATIRKGIEWDKGSPAPGEREEINYVQGKKTDFRTILRVLLSIMIPFYILFRSFWGSPDSHIEAALFVAMILCYVFLIPKKQKSVWRSVTDWFLVLVSVAIGIYVVWSYGVFFPHTEYFAVEILGSDIAVDTVAGTILLLLVLEANRRALGWVLVILVGIFVVYIPARPFLPGFLYGTPISWDVYILQMFSKGSGIYGTGTEVLVGTIFLFMMFGAIMIESRVGSFFTSLANGLVGNQTGGPAKVAVLTSAMIGTVNSSGLASAATTGPITIPMMKASGFKPHDAAAIEAVAATGGSFTPPVMGSTAYLMCQFLEIPYGKLIFFAAPVAFLYYVAVYVSVDAKARRGNLLGLPKDLLPSAMQCLKEGWHLIVPVIVMVALLTMGFSISRVGFVAIAGMLIMSFVRKETRLSPMRMLSMFSVATRATTLICTTMILVGVLISVVDVTGLGLTLSMMVEKLAGGNLLVGLILSAIVAFILGIPLPPLMVYLYGVVFMIPALIDMGANPLAAHMFFFYYGTISPITPPVCVTAFATAAIADAPMMKTGWTATKMAYTALLLPFLFVFNPALLLQGVTWADVVPLLLAFVGICILSTGIEGYFLGPRSVVERILLIATGLGMIFILVWQWVGYAGLIVFVLWGASTVLRERKSRRVAREISDFK
jgi:TRAP transporter 4TM/12TM fusion protein